MYWIRDQSFRLGLDFMGYTKKSMDLLRHASPVLKIFVRELENLNSKILAMDVEISSK